MTDSGVWEKSALPAFLVSAGEQVSNGSDSTDFSICRGDVRLTDSPEIHPSATPTRLEQLANEAAVAEGCQLVEVAIVPEGGSRVLRVFLDREDGPLQLDHCAAVSDRLSALLDLHDPITGEYRLEVSSPGLTRPVKKREDFIRFQGRLVVVHVFAALSAEPPSESQPVGPGKSAARKSASGANRKMVKGILQGMEEDDVLIRLKDNTVIRVPFRLIGKAHLDFEF
ncbi:MAG: ribosome maturation factor RimP [Magnetococcales bacterium]|nr:ribosome maturation factor RimP [Magnetococcales bacterium]